MFLDTYPQHIESRENLAASYTATKDYTNASAQYKIIYEKNPDNFKNFAEYGIALLNTNESEKAVEMLERAIEKMQKIILHIWHLHRLIKIWVK